MGMVSGLGDHRDPGNIRAQGPILTLNPCKTEPQPYNNQYLPDGTMHPDPPLGNYIHVNIRFLSCGWANQSLDSDDHFSHMTWPMHGSDWEPAGGPYPASHPIQYPNIFMENYVYITDRMREEWNKTAPNFILANGDTTGLSYHADFVSGWDHQFLQKALDTCGNLGYKLQDWPVFANNLTDPVDHDCRMEGMISAEDVGTLAPLDTSQAATPSGTMMARSQSR
jgi:hypothetical protein